MRLLFIAGLLSCAFPVWGEEAVGRVRAIYYQAAPGVMVDASMLRRPGAVRWADVEIDGADKRRALVQMPKQMEASVGDILTVDLAGPKSMALAVGEPMPMNRAVAVHQQPQLAGPDGASSGASR